MVDADTVRQNVKDMLVRLLAGGESDLAPVLVHPEFVNHEADPERRNGLRVQSRPATGCAPASATSPTRYTACWSTGTWRRHT